MTVTPVRTLLIALAAAGAVLATVPLASALLALPMRALTRDVAAVAGLHPLTGMLSSLGILLWWTSASIWLFTAALQWHRRDQPSSFAIYSGALSTYLALDDLFLLHEQLLPRYVGIPEKVVYALIATAVLLYLLVFANALRRQSDSGLLLVSLGFLAASVAVDVTPVAWLPISTDGVYLLEDGLKWFGVVFWAGFCVARCAKELAVESSLASRSARPGQPSPAPVHEEPGRRLIAQPGGERSPEVAARAAVSSSSSHVV